MSPWPPRRAGRGCSPRSPGCRRGSVSVSPTRSNSRSWSTRRSFTCSFGVVELISSRKIVPVWAASNRPARLATAPVNEPRTWPKSSLSSRLSERAPQLTRTNGPLPRGESSWIARAIELLAGARLAERAAPRRSTPPRGGWSRRPRASPGSSRSGPRSARPWGRHRVGRVCAASRERGGTVVRSASRARRGWRPVRLADGRVGADCTSSRSAAQLARTRAARRGGHARREGRQGQLPQARRADRSARPRRRGPAGPRAGRSRRGSATAAARRARRSRAARPRRVAARPTSQPRRPSRARSASASRARARRRAGRPRGPPGSTAAGPRAWASTSGNRGGRRRSAGRLVEHRLEEAVEAVDDRHAGHVARTS